MKTFIQTCIYTFSHVTKSINVYTAHLHVMYRCLLTISQKWEFLNNKINETLIKKVVIGIASCSSAIFSKETYIEFSLIKHDNAFKEQDLLWQNLRS
jgi:hypothetical protein